MSYNVALVLCVKGGFLEIIFLKVGVYYTLDLIPHRSDLHLNTFDRLSYKTFARPHREEASFLDGRA